jgi:hypothetical protein
MLACLLHPNQVNEIQKVVMGLEAIALCFMVCAYMAALLNRVNNYRYVGSGKAQPPCSSLLPGDGPCVFAVGHLLHEGYLSSCTSLEPGT